VLYDLPNERLQTGMRRGALEAPENGYNPELILTAEQLHNGVTFFFRNQGYYGKGNIPRLRLSRDAYAIERSSLILYINPTQGDRNLEDAEDARDQLNHFH